MWRVARFGVGSGKGREQQILERQSARRALNPDGLRGSVWPILARWGFASVLPPYDEPAEDER
jgi:hypothetical protein